MPIYEYECAKCESDFEVEQRITEDPVKSCPLCKSRRVKRVISRTSFVLKGGGWYSDLYSSTSGKDDKDATDAKDAKGEPKTETKTDSSSDSKDATKSKSDSKNTEKGAVKPKGAGKGSKAVA